MTPPDHQRPHDEPGVANAEQGQVLLDGPDAVAVALTPGAAEETARRLQKAAASAREQDAAAAK